MYPSLRLSDAHLQQERARVLGEPLPQPAQLDSGFLVLPRFEEAPGDLESRLGDGDDRLFAFPEEAEALGFTTLDDDVVANEPSPRTAV